MRLWIWYDLTWKQTSVLLLTLFFSHGVIAEQPLRLYLDADQTGTVESTLSIEQGIRTALSEVDNKIVGRPVELVKLDHQGNSARSRQHLEQYVQDDNAVAVFSGLHSPPLLANLNFINQNHILTLVPWAAAGPITRYADGDNWIFRLSIDDSKAGYVITNYAMKQREFKVPHLLLERTGWGKANHKVMSKALKDLGYAKPRVTWFHWNIPQGKARAILRTIGHSNADVLLFVGNAPEGKTFAKAMLQLPEAQRLPIASHWGITGGDFPKVIDITMREQLDLAFIQTCFSFLNIDNNAFAQNVLNQAGQLFPELKTAYDVHSPTGFIHAYDLTKLFIEAVAQAELTGDIVQDRAAIRIALEDLQNPVTGLLKTYNKPFSAFSKINPDAHEALNIKDFTMGHYGKQGEIILY